jgi:anti-sigma-K factor RskA
LSDLLDFRRLSEGERERLSPFSAAVAEAACSATFRTRIELVLLRLEVERAVGRARRAADGWTGLLRA